MRRVFLWMHISVSSDKRYEDECEPQEVQERDEQRRNVSERRGGEHLACGGYLFLRQDPFFDEHLFCAPRCVELHGQRDEHEQGRKPVERDPHIDGPFAVGNGLPENVQQKPDDDDGQSQAGSDVCDGHKHVADLVGDVARAALHDVPDFMCGNGDCRNGRASVGAHRKIDLLSCGVVVVGELAFHAVDGNVRHTAVAHEARCCIVARHARTRLNAVIFGIRRADARGSPCRESKARDQQQ